jgi:hypothetical protein
MPSSDTTPLPERVASSYEKLSAIAKDLNTVSDELGQSINQIDSALKKLNLGVSVWVTIVKRHAEPQNNEFWEEADQIGYAKKNGKWGICIRTVGEDLQDPDHSTVDEWLFSDAPRQLRLSAIDKVPALLEALAKQAEETTKDIQARLRDAHAVADAVTVAAHDRLPIRGGTTHPPTKQKAEGSK